ncbi:uncharacterized protein C7orf57 homolog [Cheilinus undulatus]|uniref:uncharacterized protein C7orf57 homolog n=1 Tax=Cheilinus undulatus TaxID=241271 RepID=UPI001BD4D980|nr:uncharacterized protein C7orf57 homolog [Cheilinus undulatus]
MLAKRERRGVESVSELAGWHSYHGTNSPGTEENCSKTAGRAREGASGGDWGNAEPAMYVSLFPSPDPDSDSQRVSTPSGTHRWFAPRSQPRLPDVPLSDHYQPDSMTQDPGEQQAPTKRSGISQHGTNGHISQIPGLSPSISSLHEERARGRRVGVLDSDSDYIKLAKQGGHKGLLWHEDTVAATPKSYKPSDWFSAAGGIDDPSLINSAEKKNPAAFQPLEPPFGTDNMSAWERDDNSSSGKEKNNNAQNSEMEELQASSQFHETSKFRRIVFDKKPAPVDMSKLLSFGYLEDDKPKTANSDLSSE